MSRARKGTPTMSKLSNFYPPVTAGDILREFLNDFNLSASRLANSIHVPASRILTILNGDRAISADTALRLARYFKTTPQFWMNAQSAYDLEIASREKLALIESTIEPTA